MSATSKSGKAGSRARPAPAAVPQSLSAEFVTTAIAEAVKSGVTVRIGNRDGVAVIGFVGWSVRLEKGAAVFTVPGDSPPAVAVPAGALGEGGAQ